MEAEDYSACAFSLICQEDGADLDGNVDDGDGRDKLFFMYNDAEEEEEYMEQLVSKESSFCAPSYCSSSACSDDGDGDSSSSMVSEDWFKCARHAAVKWILETRGYFGFSHRTAYLAIAYFDRFCLRRCIDKGMMPWAARLLSIACTSLAAKMEEYRAPALSDFRVDDYEFSCVSVRRMELLVLTTLEWRMNAVTPFDYLPYFTSKFHQDDATDGDALMVLIKAIGFIFATTEVASVLDYRPSTVAAAAIVAASCGRLSKELLESKIMSSLSPSCLLEKEHVYACYSLMFKESKKTAKRLLAACSDSNNNNNNHHHPSTYDSVDVIDDTASFTAAAAAAAAASNKRMRLELPTTIR